MIFYIILFFTVKICNAFYFNGKNGINITYTVSFLSVCRSERDRFGSFVGLSLPDCVAECGLRPYCRSLTFRRDNICELFKTDNRSDISSGTLGSCIFISASNIMVEKSPCSNCKQGQVCGVQSGQCIYKECPPAVAIENGTVLGNMYAVGNRISYTCKRGFKTNITESFSVCQDNGMWSNGAVCIEKDCGNVIQIENGTAKLVNGETTFNSKATVICNAAHEPDKDNITCLETGEWETAECIKLDYKLVRDDFTWDEAKVNCENLSGRLADIKSAAEQDEIEKLLPPGNNLFWSGGNLNIASQSYEWLDGTKIFDGYINWDHNEPDGKAYETVIMLYQKETGLGYKWNNAPPEWRIGSVCEFE